MTERIVPVEHILEAADAHPASSVYDLEWVDGGLRIDFEAPEENHG